MFLAVFYYGVSWLQLLLLALSIVDKVTGIASVQTDL